MHELLPWYVNGTLGPAERKSFETHLAECASCRRELALVRDLQTELQESGLAALSDHPSPDALLAAADPAAEDDRRLDPDAAAEIRRHLAICPTCAEEIGWLTGETVAQAGPPTAEKGLPRRRVLLPWLGFAAALLLVAVLLPLAWRQRGEPAYTGSVPTGVVASTQRAERPATIDVPAGARRIDLFFDVDLGPADFPARLSVKRGAEEVATVAVDRPDQLFQGLYVLLSCHRVDCPDGDFVARLSRASGGPAVEFRFRLQTSAAIR